MSIKSSPARRVFVVVNTILLTAVGILCVLPILNVLAISFSSSAAANANQVLFWPVDFNTLSYEYVMEHAEFGRAFLISVVRVLIGLPKEIEESAFIDGAGYWTSLIKIYLPLSLPSLATVALFTIVGHWNSWFDGMIYITTPSRVPMQTYLRSILIDMNVADMSADDYELYAMLANRTVKCSQIIVATIPILCVYPFLQRYFVSGIVLGSVKG